MSDRRLVAVVVVASGALAAEAGGEPTGHAAADALLQGGLGALTALAGHKARRAAWVVSLGLVSVGANGPASIAGLLALAGIGVTARVGPRGASRQLRVIGALVGALTVNMALRLRWPDRFGATAVLAAVAIAVVLFSGWGRARRRTRRRLTVALGVTAGVVVLAVAMALVPLLVARGRADEALEAGLAGITAARLGESDAAVAHFERAQDLLGDVERAADGWWGGPARAVPFVAQHLDAVEVAVDAADDLTRVGADVAREVHIDRVRPRDGRVDVDALASFAEPLARTEALLEDVVDRLAAVDERWLLSPLRVRVDDVTNRVAEARGDNRSALDAARAVPELLGRGGQKRWFLAVVTPSELRGGGGIMGSWGILTATDGTLELPVFERLASLYRPFPYTFDVEPDWNRRYVEEFQLARYPQNLVSSPHFPSTAEAIRQVAEQAGVGPIDGVLAVDPYALAALLRLTGPIDVPGWPEPITADNAAELLLFRQYERSDDANRADFLEATTRELFGRLTSGDLPSPAEIASTLGPIVKERRLRFTAFDDDERRYLDALGTTAPLELPEVDSIGLVTHNAAPSKLDWFLRRSVHYELDLDERSGDANGTVEVRLRNTAPRGEDLGPYFHYLFGGLAPGVNRQLVSLYSALPVTSATLDGDVVELDRSVERGHAIADVFVTLEPGQEVVLRFDLDGRLDLRDGYRLAVHRQPTAAPDDVEVVVNERFIVRGDQRTDVRVTTHEGSAPVPS